jgi:hypothetical protein
MQRALYSRHWGLPVNRDTKRAGCVTKCKVQVLVYCTLVLFVAPRRAAALQSRAIKQLSKHYISDLNQLCCMAQQVHSTHSNWLPKHPLHITHCPQHTEALTADVVSTQHSHTHSTQTTCTRNHTLD